MFKNIENFYNWIETIITAILGVSSGLIIYEIQAEKGHKWIIALVAVVLIVLAEKILHIIFSKVVNNSQRLRRTLLREHYIEGKWLGTVYNTGETSEIYGYSIVTIIYTDKGYEVLGRIFDPKTDQFNGGFKSSDSHYYSEERIFSYFFTGFNQFDGSPREIVGRTRLEVTHRNPIPLEFMGTIFDTKNRHELNLTITKIEDSLLAEHNIDTKAGVKKLLEEMI
jgi:hypothetical protein